MLKILIKSVVIKNSETDYNMQFQNGLKSSCSQERYFQEFHMDMLHTQVIILPEDVIFIIKSNLEESTGRVQIYNAGY